MHSRARGARLTRVTEFRAKCLGLIDEVAETGREIVITKRGRAVAWLVPLRRRPGAPFGLYRDEVRIHGDIGAPIDVEWQAGASQKRSSSWSFKRN